jgi:hypothetical protein
MVTEPGCSDSKVMPSAMPTSHGLLTWHECPEREPTWCSTASGEQHRRFGYFLCPPQGELRRVCVPQPHHPERSTSHVVAELSQWCVSRKWPNQSWSQQSGGGLVNLTLWKPLRLCTLYLNWDNENWEARSPFLLEELQLPFQGQRCGSKV